MHAMATGPDSKRALLFRQNLDDFGRIMGGFGLHNTPRGLLSAERPDGL
jgi:hypothetical protein